MTRGRAADRAPSPGAVPLALCLASLASLGLYAVALAVVFVNASYRLSGHTAVVVLGLCGATALLLGASGWLGRREAGRTTFNRA